MSLRLYNAQVLASKQGEANSIAGIPVVGTPQDGDFLQYSDGVLSWQACNDCTHQGPTGPVGPMGPQGPVGEGFTVETVDESFEINPNVSITMLNSMSKSPSTIAAPYRDGAEKIIVNVSKLPRALVHGSFLYRSMPYTHLSFKPAGAAEMTWIDNHKSWIVSSITNVALL